MSEIKLEVGKTYRSRNGKEVKIVEYVGSGRHWPYYGNLGKSYTSDGRWQNLESPDDLIAEVPEVARHTFAIPDGVKEITLDYFGNRIVVEMVPEKEPKPGDVMVNPQRSVYIFKEIVDNDTHRHFAWFGEYGPLTIDTMCYPGRPATPEEAQPLWDALKKAGKRWNAETMEVEDVPEVDRIREWVWANLEYGTYDRGDVADAIENYLKHKEGEK